MGGTQQRLSPRLRAQVARRKEVEAAIRELKAEQRYIEKALAL